ncbi:ABC transporter permease [Paraclostridium ghonii]|uniref:ABC transport system permease protein n=1 Tax=Paraclostridium ghonii TaxID=29358 RepID=A0ABU0N2D8_9FIRM|nr:ABC transporter permease [Paeniclostridium ghonii]MDQ0557124.1 putative ABC transport system permease protein [Paeniclostridium ghonii]
MNFIFRAFKSLKERKLKTLITFCITLIICIAALTSFSIQSATQIASLSAKQKLGATVTLSQDMKKMMENNSESQQEDGNPPKFKPEKISVPLSYLDEFKNSKYVVNYAISSNTSANLEGLSAVGSSDDSDSSSDNKKELDSMKKPNSGDVSIYGLNDFNMGEKVDSKSIELESGRVFTEEDLNKNVLLIESTFAKENSLSVGDTITLKSTDDEVTIEAEVIGIFKDNSEVDDNAYRFSSMLPYNNIYAPYTLSNTLKGDDYKDSVDSIKFYINDPDNVEKFIKESENANVDFDKFKLDSGDKSYEEMIAPIENIASFSKITLIVVAIFGASILTLIIMLSIKDRMNEIGILMSLGERKLKIISQLLTEILLVLIVSIGISALCGNSISNSVANQLIQTEISSSQNQNDFPSNNQDLPGRGFIMDSHNFGENIHKTNTIDTLEVNVDSTDFFKMSICSIAISIVSTIVPTSFVMRLNPKNILSKHN